jgi:hypothetical protein
VPGEWPDQILERHSGRLECREPAPTSGLGFQAIQKIARLKPARGSSGESGIIASFAGVGPPAFGAGSCRTCLMKQPRK